MKRVVVAAMLAVVLGAQAYAQAPVIGELGQDSFRALQYSKAKSVWGETEARVVRVAFIKDGKLDAAETAVLAALRKGAFEFTIRGIQTATFKPNDVALKGTLDAAGIALLTISAADLNASVNQKANESRAAFLLRRRNEGMVELAALIETDAKARDEARTVIAERFNDGIIADAARSGGGGPAASNAGLKQVISSESNAGDLLPAAAQPKWRAFLQEAAVLVVRKRGYNIGSFEKLFGGLDQAQAQEPVIAQKLGLPDFFKTP